MEDRVQGPFYIEADEFGFGWDCIAERDDLISASRTASRVVKSWEIRNNERRVRILDKDGKEL